MAIGLRSAPTKGYGGIHAKTRFPQGFSADALRRI
jgi:hypothetical protein